MPRRRGTVLCQAHRALTVRPLKDARTAVSRMRSCVRDAILGRTT